MTVTWTVYPVGCGQTKNASSVPSFVVMKTFCKPESLKFIPPCDSRGLDFGVLSETEQSQSL